jgi:hypothetical protein
MYTSVAWFALSGFLAFSAIPEQPGWVREYRKARQLGKKEEKPLAVFIGSGKAGWEQVSKAGRLAPDVKRLLNDHYVCVYVNTDEEAGKRLAVAFEIPDGLGVVISSRSGDLQAFRHEGDLTDEALASYLGRFANPQQEVTVTETNPPPRVSYYQPVQPYYPPMGGFAPSFGGFGGRGGC